MGTGNHYYLRILSPVTLTKDSPRRHLMLLDRKGQLDIQRGLLYILTGNKNVLPPLTKRGRVKKAIPTFISSWKPEVLEDKSRSGGAGPANPNMNEGRAWQRERENGKFKSHSQDIEDFAKRAGYFRCLSNKRKKPRNPRQSPCHRNMTAGERNGTSHPNVGPHMR